jgi:hypothetical protein
MILLPNKYKNFGFGRYRIGHFEIRIILTKLKRITCTPNFILQDDVSGCFEYYADLAEALDEKQYSPVALPMTTFKTHVLKEPIGVVGLITPW